MGEEIKKKPLGIFFVMAAGIFLTFILDYHPKFANIFLSFSHSFFWLTVALLLDIYLYVNRFGADD